MPEQNAAAGQDFFSRLPDTRKHLIALLLLFLVPFVLFTAITIGGMELQRHDITQWRAGAESIIEYRDTYGEEPLWAENMFGGMPAYVVWVKTQVPHLDTLATLFKGIYPAFQYWVMLSGMYFLLVLMNFRSLTSVFGSLMYGLTTYFPIIIVAGHTSKFSALAFAPWMIAGYWLLSRKQKKLPGLLLFSVATALELRAGHPQITYYFIYLLGFLWLFDTYRAYKEKDLKNWGIITALLFAGGIVGIMGHAQKLLTLQEYAAYSIRGGSALDSSTGLSSGYAFAWSQGIRETLTIFIPNLFGGASPDYWGPKSVTSGPHYFGALCLPLLLTALFRQKSKTMYVFFGTGTLAIFFAWGQYFPLLNEFAFDYIPYFSKFRAPETWLTLSAFCYTLVAVYGLEWIVSTARSKSEKLRTMYLPAGITAGVAVVLFLMVNSMDFSRPGEVQGIASQIARQNNVSVQNPQVQQRASQYVNTNLVPAREEKARGDMLRFGVIVVLGFGLIWLLFERKVSASVALAGFILISGFDMITTDKRYIPENNFVPGNVSPEKTLESRRRDIDTYIQDNIADGTEYPFRVFPLLDNPYSEATPAYFYPSIGGYTGAKLSIIQDVMYGNGPLNVQSQNFNIQLLDLFNVKYITYTEQLPLPGYEIVYRGQQGVVYENTSVLPKAFFVDSVITETDPQAAINNLMPGATDLRNTAVVETTESFSIQADSSATAEITEYTARDITIETSRDTDGFMVLSEVYYPAGWKATLDGVPVSIYKTNYFLRGFRVPAGDHTIKLRFEPATYSTGVTLAWMALGIHLLLAGYLVFTKVKSPDRES